MNTTTHIFQSTIHPPRRPFIAFLIVLMLFSPGVSLAQEADDWSWQTSPDFRIGAPVDMADLVDIDGMKIYEVYVDEEYAEYIVGLFKVLRSFKVNGAVRNTMNNWASLNRTRFAVQRCPKIPHKKDRLASYYESWGCDATLTALFFLKGRQKFGIEVGGGYGKIIDGIKGSVFSRIMDIYIDWDADNRVLSVATADLIDGDEIGPQRVSGYYQVRARSVQTALSKSTSVNSGISAGGISLGVESSFVKSKKRLRTTIRGNTFVANLGLFSAIERQFSDGSSVIEFGIECNWLTDMCLNYDENAFIDYVACEGKRKFGFNLSVKDSLAGNFEKSGETSCVTDKRQLPVTVTWKAQPTTDVTHGELDGLRCRIRFIVERDADGDSLAYYQPVFRSGINWYLKVAAKGDTGGGILVDANGVGDKIAGKRFRKSEF